MQTFIGESGLYESWQEPFAPTIKCHKCGGEARILFTAVENERGEEIKFICDLRLNGSKGDYWVHDAIACAVYLCKDCFETTSELNQA